MSRKRHAKAFVFDLDGTLIDSGRDIAASANFTRGRFGLPRVGEDEALGWVGDGVGKLLERALTRDGVGPAPEEHAEGLAVFADHYGRHCLDTTTAYPGALDVLRRLSAFPLMIATNKPRAFTETILRGLRLDGAFRRVVAGDDVPVKKPDPASLRLCLEGLGVAPADAAMVGDSLNDIGAARAMGCTAVGCTYGLRPAGEIAAAEPDVLLHAFAELTDHFATRDTA